MPFVKFDPGACWNGHVSAGACSPPRPSLHFIFLFTFNLSITPRRVCALACAWMWLYSGNIPSSGYWVEQWIEVVLAGVELPL